MTNSLPASILLGAANITDKRRGSRLMMEIPVTVMGMNTLGEPFKETTVTTSISCFGCKLRTKRYAEKNSTLTLEIRRAEMPSESRIVHGRVVWVQRPRHHRETFQIGVELEEPGNVWGIDAPPPDWFPCAADMVTRQMVEARAVEPAGVAAPVTLETAAPATVAPLAAAPAPLPQVDVEIAAPTQSSANLGLSVDWETLTLPEPAPIPAVLSGAGNNGSQESAVEAAKLSAEAAIAEEIALLRKHFTGSLDAVLIETLEIFSKRTAEIVDEAREACRASVREMETEIRRIARPLQESTLRESVVQESAVQEKVREAPLVGEAPAPTEKRVTVSAPRRKRAPKVKVQPAAKRSTDAS